MAGQPDPSSMLDDAKSFWGKFRKGLNDMWRELLSNSRGGSGLGKAADGKVIEEGLSRDGSMVYTIELMSGKRFKVRLEMRSEANKKEKDDVNIYNVYFQADDGFETKDLGVRQDKVREAIRQFVVSHYKDDEEDGESFEVVTDEEGTDVTEERSREHVAQNTKTSMRFTLSRIVGAKEDTIVLTKIRCGEVAPADALDMIDTITSDDAFSAALPEGESTYEVTDSENEMDVQPCNQAVDIGESFVNLMRSAVGLYHNLKYLEWNAQGADGDKIHRLAEDRSWDIRYMIDTLAELCFEHTKSVPHMSMLVQADPQSTESDIISADGAINLQAAMSYIEASARALIATLECYYCNMPHDVQPTFDSWIRQWKEFVDNRLARLGNGQPVPLAEAAIATTPATL